MKMKKSQNKILPAPVAILRKVESDPNKLRFFQNMEHKRRQMLSQGTKTWASWCFFPNTLFMTSLVRPDSLASIMSTIQKVVSQRGWGEAVRDWTMFTWRQTRGIYRFDETVYQSVARTQINKIPTEILYRLPEWCVFIENPGDITLRGERVSGFFALITDDNTSQRLYLTAIRDDNRWLQSVGLDLSFKTIHEALDEALDLPRGIRPGPIEDGERGDFRKFVEKALSLLLYLCSLKPDIRHVSGDDARMPRNPRPGDIPKDRADTKDWHVWKTGFRVGRVIRDEEEKQAREHHGGTKRPHVRVGHYHHYWIGPNHEEWTGPKDDPDNKRQLILKWVYQTTVNVRDSEDIQPTVRVINKKEVSHEKETEIHKEAQGQLTEKQTAIEP